MPSFRAPSTSPDYLMTLHARLFPFLFAYAAFGAPCAFSASLGAEFQKPPVAARP